MIFMKRRDFLTYSLISAPALATEISPLSLINYKALRKLPPDLKLSFQDGIAPGKNPEERFDFMEEHGIEGFEPKGTDILNNTGKIQNLLRYRNIKISAVKSGYRGFLFSSDHSVRNKHGNIIREMIAAAGELKATGVIIIPGTGKKVPGNFKKSDFFKYSLEELSTLAEYATKHDTTIILKPVNRKESSFINTIAQTAEICRSVNLKGLRCMGDFWHMTLEETSDMDAIISGGEFLNHFHIASRKSRFLPGTDGYDDDYTEAFRGLKKINYRGYISLVCGISGDRNLTVPSSVSLIESQWLSS